MKKQTTIKNIKKNYTKTFQTGYCALQDIFCTVEPNYYNTGVYGWNCDIYTDDTKNIAITTGYRNLTGLQIPNEIINKYSEIARNILKNRFIKKVDITAPLYWWKEFDTYKVGTVRNSCSTMHKIHVKSFYDEILKALEENKNSFFAEIEKLYF